MYLTLLDSQQNVVLEVTSESKRSPGLLNWGWARIHSSIST